MFIEIPFYKLNDEIEIFEKRFSLSEDYLNVSVVQSILYEDNII